MDLVARGGDDRDVEQDRLRALAQDREEGDEGEAQQGAAAQRGVRLLLDVLVPRLVGGLVDHPVGHPDQHDDREERGEALEKLLVRARQGGDVAEEESQADGQAEGDRHAAPHDGGLLLVASLGQVGQDGSDDQDRLHALTQDHEEGGQELGDPRGCARAVGGLVGSLAGVAVEGVGVLADVVRQRREVLVDRGRVVIGHGLLQERELHLHLRDARAGDAGHDLLLHAGDLVVLVVGVVDLVLAALGVARLEGGHAFVDQAVDRGRHIAPRLISGARGRGEHRRGQGRHHGHDQNATESLTNTARVSANTACVSTHTACVSAKHCHHLPPDDPAIR